jgi:hypothetical protein
MGEDVCGYPLPHRGRERSGHVCGCMCVLAPGHGGRHRCEYVEGQRLASERKREGA